jgi:hypothetical protein
MLVWHIQPVRRSFGARKLPKFGIPRMDTLQDKSRQPGGAAGASQVSGDKALSLLKVYP